MRFLQIIYDEGIHIMFQFGSSHLKHKCQSKQSNMPVQWDNDAKSYNYNLPVMA